MISTTPEWVARYIQHRGSFAYKDQTHEYLIVDPQLAVVQGAPPIFTICKNGVLAVSSDYPAEWRELGLMHEIAEQDLSQHEMCCLEALKEELGLARQQNVDMASYIAFRIGFFKNLIGFYTSNTDFEGRDELVKKLTHSLNHLLSLEQA